jgi:ribosomal protein L35AE/L33A
MAIRSNAADIVMISVIGEIISPRRPTQPYSVTHDGRAVVLPGTGGIVYNVRVGDRAIGWASDHMEPGVTIKNKDEQENSALNILACIGNEAVVVSGEAKGARGTVTGKHGGAEHVMVDFQPDVLEKLAIGDKVQVRAYGRGLQLLDAPEVKLLNMSVQLLEALPLELLDGGAVQVPVAGIVPPELMGSGVGHSPERGDYDIQTADRDLLAQHGLAALRLGDLVAIRDQDHSFGRGYRKGAVSVAVVSHSDSLIAGHGPGVTTLMTSATGKIQPRIAPDEANIATLLRLRD